MQTCLIFNPAARGGKAKSLRNRLNSLSAQCVLQPTSAPGDARPLAAQAVRDGFQTIIAAGGDGTVNEVLNGIGDVPNGLSRTRLGILPLGTVNVFARELGMPQAVHRAWEVLCAGNEIQIDLPVAEFVIDGTPARRYFIQLAGAGLDSRAIELVDWSLKKKIGPLAYVFAGLKALGEVHPLITIEGAPSAAGELVLLGNGRYYGGSFIFFPKARLQDGLVHVCVFPKVRWSLLLRVVAGLATGHLHQLCAAGQTRGTSVTLKSASRVLLELDGENVGQLPAKISIIPKGLRVIVPAACQPSA